MNTQPLQELVQKTKQIDPRKLGRKTFTYIDIAAIDRETKQIVATQLLPVEDAPSRARKLIHRNDVLISTVRPNLNAVAIVPAAYDGEIGSTGFCVLRTYQELLDAHYLYYFGRTNEFINRLTRVATGASYPAVTDDDILETEIPLPPFPEQRRVAAILARADRLRRLRHYALQFSERFLQAVFVEMFGDPVTNPMGWDVLPFEEVATNLDHRRKPIKQSERDKRSGKYPYYGSSGLIDTIDDYLFDETALLISEDGKNLLFRNRPIAYIASGKYWVNNHAHIVVENGTATLHYLRELINMRDISGYISGIDQIKLTQGSMDLIPVPVPPLALQNKFTHVATKYEHLRAQQREALRQAEHLFQTLLHKAFRGELSTSDGAAVDAALAEVPARNGHGAANGKLERMGLE